MSTIPICANWLTHRHTDTRT